MRVLSHLRGPVGFVPDLDLSDERRELDEVLASCDASPEGRFLARTAEGYALAAAMLEASGTPEFTRYSVALYGAPTDPLLPFAATNLEGAHHFLDASEALDLPDAPASFSAEEAQEWLAERVDVPVVLSPDLASQAAAGARRIRLRADVRFSEVQLRQLLAHEYEVHTLTKQNGQDQKLAILGRSSPRTTETQEGLATFAELITDTLDVRRLRRIALRVVGVQAALEGADVVQVAGVFEEGGQTAHEGAMSAARIFRGGGVFTKDVVYVRGLLRVHAFLIAAVREKRPELVHRLFAGRMTLEDCQELELEPPTRLPGWAAELRTLSAYLAWAGFNARLPLVHVGLADLK